MTRYHIVRENVKNIGGFKGDPIVHPLYQCSDCSHVINPSFMSTTEECGLCYDGSNNIGEYLTQIHSVTIYASQGAFSDHKFTNHIDDIKEGEYAEEMAELLEWGVESLGELQKADYLVPPPRGSDDAEINHMKNIGEHLSEKVGIPLQDPLRKSEEYTSQKEIEDPEKRKENVKDNFYSEETFEDDPTIIIIDDVATSCGTLKYGAKALIEAGADKVVGLAISRSEPLDRLKDAEIYKPENNED